MFLKTIKFILLYCVFHVCLVVLTMPQVLIDLKQASSSEQVLRLVRDRELATQSQLIFRDTNFSHAANLDYHGSRSTVLTETCVLGTFVFVHVHNSKTGEFDRHEIKYTPAPKRIFASIIIFALFYWLGLPILDRRLQSNSKSN
ncbi:MAG: hypothetical protein HRT81_11390 [Henriciella sp.]|nr:hypothetical protein [Henriciella sp.]